MIAEIPLQIDLFTGELVDTRTAAQKQAERERYRPTQLSMFSATEQVEQTAPARPWLQAFPAPVLLLAIQDVRTDEEKERDMQREAEKLTISLFDDPERVEPLATPVTDEKAKASTSIPILWTSRADMLKRRPDLVDKINALPDDDLEELAGLIGEAVQEFYWIQLNVVLSLYLDHDLHLTRVAHGPSSPSSEPPFPPVPDVQRVILTHCP